ncbi:MAG: cupin domain-containing protein [Acidimicrobiaceae bacterium]|nr:cupin domain-containing protein [Acidimicrobiaceae bacterium]
MTDSLWLDLEERSRTRFERSRQAACVVPRNDAHREDVAGLGTLRWYLHPSLEDRALSSLYMVEIEIDAGMRSDRIKHPGNIVGIVVEGSGELWLDGEIHEWCERDLLGIPSKPHGVLFDFFNTGDVAARIILAFPNWDSALGPGLGTGIEHMPLA